jgi:hypothetical protein
MKSFIQFLLQRKLEISYQLHALEKSPQYAFKQSMGGTHSSPPYGSKEILHRKAVIITHIHNISDRNSSTTTINYTNVEYKKDYTL